MMRGGRGVRQKVILHDEGGRGGRAKSDFVLQFGFDGQTKMCFSHPKRVASLFIYHFKSYLEHKWSL